MKKIMLSSTAVDLPLHRQEAINACLRAEAFPIAMEYLPALDVDAMATSLSMVDEADVYIGIYGQRYGTVPSGHSVSITEMEFDRAVARHLPILVFIMHRDHPITIDMVEVETAASEKLARLKAKACAGRVRAEFKSPIELRGQIVEALVALFEREGASHTDSPPVKLHAQTGIPKTPTRYIAHPYTLLQTKDVRGRKTELKILTDWVTINEYVPAGVKVLSVVAFGGMGKSALTWKWFEDIAPNELPNLTGRLWWSFYESDAHWENFVIRALAYASNENEAEIRSISIPDREERLLRILDEKAFLIVLDGFERNLLAYAQTNAAHRIDDEVNGETDDLITHLASHSRTVQETYLQKHRLRRCVDPRAGAFLRKLTTVRASRVLISSRLYPAELQTETATPVPGSYALLLRGLTDDDALALWRGFIGGERSGSSEELLPLFRSFGNYPLLLRALAGEISNFRFAPGDFARWRAEHPEFNPAELHLANARTHVLEYALRGLGGAHRRLLHTIAAFRTPVGWETLRALAVGDTKPCQNERALDTILMELEDRGLVGWDRANNRYDLHPIVRAVVWENIERRERETIFRVRREFFDAITPVPADKVKSIDDLTSTIELFYSLVGLGLYNDAFDIFARQLEPTLHDRLSLHRSAAELLTALFPKGLDDEPATGDYAKSWIFLWLGYSFAWLEETDAAISMLKRHGGHCSEVVCPLHVSSILHSQGALRHCEYIELTCLMKAREPERPVDDEGMCLWLLAGTYLTCGKVRLSRITYERSRKMCIDCDGSPNWEGGLTRIACRLALHEGNWTKATSLAARIWAAAELRQHFADMATAAELISVVALRSGDIAAAEQWGVRSLQIAREHSLTDGVFDLPLRASLACVLAQSGRAEEASTLLEFDLDLYRSPAQGSIYVRANACHALALIKRNLGEKTEAIAAASAAYRLSWCDGDPYSYHRGLRRATEVLEELGASRQVQTLGEELKCISPSGVFICPEVDLNPRDKFHVTLVPPG
jgi:tetratricopeptide (TPR) repeat protein